MVNLNESCIVSKTVLEKVDFSNQKKQELHRTSNNVINDKGMKMTCEACQWTGKSISQHLKKTRKPCQEYYDAINNEINITELREKVLEIVSESNVISNESFIDCESNLTIPEERSMATFLSSESDQNISEELQDTLNVKSNKVKCKGCKWEGKSLLQHLNKVKRGCREFYDMDIIRKERKSLKQLRKEI